jgi:hypothetical protein
MSKREPLVTDKEAFTELSVKVEKLVDHQRWYDRALILLGAAAAGNAAPYVRDLVG